MITGLAAGLRRIGADEPALCAALERLVGSAGATPCLEATESLARGRVHRLRFTGAGPLRALVIKRLPFDRSYREQRALLHWLPRLGLEAHAVRLREVAAATGEARVWHVYEDLGGCTLERLPRGGDSRATRSALELAATLHTRAAAHPLLGEVRLAGPDLGASFFAGSVVDALRGVAALRATGADQAGAAAIDRLERRLGTLQQEVAVRCAAFTALDWPETLLHGDLWLSNFVLVARERRIRAQLIDWERTGIGPALYDLSTLLRQLPAEARPEALVAYRRCVDGAGWPWPGAGLLEHVAETCELGRYASCLAWRVLPFLETRGDGEPPPAWLLDDLVEMERWFSERTPLLPDRCAA